MWAVAGAAGVNAPVVQAMEPAEEVEEEELEPEQVQVYVKHGRGPSAHDLAEPCAFR